MALTVIYVPDGYSGYFEVPPHGPLVIKDTPPFWKIPPSTLVISTTDLKEPELTQQHKTKGFVKYATFRDTAKGRTTVYHRPIVCDEFRG